MFSDTTRIQVKMVSSIGSRTRMLPDRGSSRSGPAEQVRSPDCGHNDPAEAEARFHLVHHEPNPDPAPNQIPVLCALAWRSETEHNPDPSALLYLTCKPAD